MTESLDAHFAAFLATNRECEPVGPPRHYSASDLLKAPQSEVKLHYEFAGAILSATFRPRKHDNCTRWVIGTPAEPDIVITYNAQLEPPSLADVASAPDAAVYGMTALRTYSRTDGGFPDLFAYLYAPQRTLTVKILSSAGSDAFLTFEPTFID